jgi:hypothetical protein
MCFQKCHLVIRLRMCSVEQGLLRLPIRRSEAGALSILSHCRASEVSIPAEAIHTKKGRSTSLSPSEAVSASVESVRPPTLRSESTRSIQEKDRWYKHRVHSGKQGL